MEGKKNLTLSKIKGKLAVMVTMSFIMAMSITNLVLASTNTLDFSEVTSAITQGGFNANQILSIIGIVLGSTVSIALVWWGARKLVNSIMRAFKTGKIKF